MGMADHMADLAGLEGLEGLEDTTEEDLEGRVDREDQAGRDIIVVLGKWSLR